MMMMMMMIQLQKLRTLPSHGITYFPSTPYHPFSCLSRTWWDGVEREDVTFLVCPETMQRSGTNGDRESRATGLTQVHLEEE